MTTTTLTGAEQHDLVARWIDATNSHDLEQYLAHFTPDAVLDDPSVGRAFTGTAEIAEYFQAYFVGYDTQTRLLTTVSRDGLLHVEVEFTGDFPEGRIGGLFDVVFVGDRISHVTAALA